eukprot:scaffold204908_cov41-Tisochrysis_lutea.AAC.1
MSYVFCSSHYVSAVETVRTPLDLALSAMASLSLRLALLALLSTSGAALQHGTRPAVVLRLAAQPAALEKPPAPEEVAEKYGLEAGLFSALRSGKGAADGEGGGMTKAGDLLKRYGGAYLLTSTSLALVSFTLCYLAIDSGVDVPALLQKVNIEVSSTSETMGTVGLAYAVHKAASPIRFPPTVALTPIVARRLFGQKDDKEDSA